MINTILQSFKIDITYKINAFIYRLKRTPLIKYIIPDILYSLASFKSFIRVIVIFFNILWGLATKIAYVGLVVYFIAISVTPNTTSNFITIYIFFSIVGMFNISTLKATSKKYYSVILMNTDAKKFDIANNTLSYISNYITHTIALAIFMHFANVPIYLAPVLALLNVTLKIIGNGIDIKTYLKTKLVLSQSVKASVLTASLCIIFIALFIFFKIQISTICILLITVITAILAIFSMKYILKLDKYNVMYKKQVTPNKFIFSADVTSTTITHNQKILDKVDLSLDEKTSTKKGYDYFNAIFFKRHKKILLNSARNYTAFLLLVVVIAIAVCIFMPSYNQKINNIIMTSLPYFVIIMYFVNRGAIVTQAMFFNCDHSMLTYKFYRKPTVITSLFTKRLKTLILINLIPSLVLAIGLPLLLYITGGTSNILVYPGIFLSIIFMNIFFSVHYLVLYYLLQPYDIQMKQKSNVYNIATTITYLFCFYIMKAQIDTEIFTVTSILATGIYIILSILLVHKLAPKTFKLK